MGCSVGYQYAKNALAVGAPPQTSLGQLTTLTSLIGLGGDTSLNSHPLGYGT